MARGFTAHKINSEETTAASLPSGWQRASHSSVALHAQLADIIREKIYSMEWGMGTKIPSEHELMAYFNVSRGTVRRALKSLVDEGLLVQRHGKGTFVMEPGISHPAGLRPFSFAQSLYDKGQDFVTAILDKRVIPAPADVARELEIDAGAGVMFLRRVRSVDDEPLICQESWSNLEVCPGLDSLDLRSMSLFVAVEKCSGKRVKYSDMRYTARIAGKEHGQYLGCEEASAVLVLEQIIRLENKVPIEWGLTWLRPGQSIVSTAVQP